MKAVFDLLNTPLAPGVTLIEASAGTGKTFSLAGIILRLILEEHIAINEILAVTYTIAATAELKERVRRRLSEAVEELRRGKTTDPIIARAVAGGNVTGSLRELELALASFDEAQVFTIHSFCQRVLQDHAFETGAAFDAQLVTDPTPLFQQVAVDFWRLTLHRARPLLPVLMLAWKKSPAEWIDLLNRSCNHPNLVVLPPATNKTVQQLAEQTDRALQQLRSEWNKRRPQIEKILLRDPNLKRGAATFREDRVTDLLKKIAEACGELDCATPVCFGALAEVTAELLGQHTLNGRVTPKHRFFDLCSSFSRLVDELFAQLTHEFLQYAKHEISKRKKVTNTVTFDDLILRVRKALLSPKGNKLAEAVGRKYKAALVDEFQDTDPAQYDIFREVFGGGKHRLYYVGDPKQAIYGFRGADIFTYLAAASDAKHTFTLGTNWRSEKLLVSAVNQLFTQTKHPFVLRGIDSQEVQSTDEAQFPLLTNLPADSAAPLTFHLAPSLREDGKEMNKTQSTAAVCERVATDIATFQSSGAQLGTRAVGFADIAILVRTHKEAAQIQDVLRRRGIRSIVQSDRTVFASDEAFQLQQLLQGVLEPHRERLFKAALLTEFIGLTGDDLVELQSNELVRQQWLDRLSRWRKRWMDECFVAMFRQVIVEWDVRERLAQFPDGERRLTDLLHLSELLHAAETTQRLSPTALSSWLHKQRKTGHVARDEFQLRLESDTNAVQIVTIHKCKGLEYPIVFCPFLWTNADTDWDDSLEFHDRTNANRLTLDLRGKKLGGTPKQRAWQTEETTSEEARMLYVAVTRAKNRCTIHVPAYKDLPKSKLALLFDEAARADLAATLTGIAQGSGGSIALSVESSSLEQTGTRPTASASFSAQPFSGQIDMTAMVASFSGLNSGRIEAEELEPEVADEPEEAAEETITSGVTIFDFERGARAGDFFHAVLEQLDFSNPELQPLVNDQLKWHGFAGTKCLEAIIGTFEQLMQAELQLGLSLHKITPEKRIAELEFTFRLNRLDPDCLRDIFSRAAALPADFDRNLGRLRFNPVQGYLRGFIDLFFEFEGRYYIADWKSNWLGNRGADYGQEQMAESMLQHNYYLQAHLYALAADLFLQQTVPSYHYEQHFGGVFYVFLRGIDRTDPERGIFHQRPAEQTITTLRELAI